MKWSEGGAAMIKEVLLVHHTHTDIGYTHLQPVVLELHRRFIDMALDLADQTADAVQEAKFRWTCEVTGVARAWWDAASPERRDRFLAAVARGQFEVAAMQWHLTPLADLRMIARSLDSVRFFRDLGVPVRSAMNTDVNGVPWGLVDVLLDHGIDGFSMAINSHFGAPPKPRPGAFRWASPNRREITVWNGFQYWHAANVLMGLPQGIEKVESMMPAFLEEAERRGYPYEFLPVQITNPHHPDNAAPDPALSAFVADWNARNPAVRLRTVLLTEIFDRLRKLDLPVVSGDWTDYWNFGAGSSARETTVFLDGLRVLDAAHGASILSGAKSDQLDPAHESLALFAEHTWGADRSISAPESIESRAQWAMKAAYVYQGLAHARIARRDALHDLSVQAGGEETMALFYNPTPVGVSVPVAVPAKGFEWYVTPGLHHRQRLEGLLTDLPTPSTAEDASRWARVDVPPLGYRAMPLAALPTPTSEGLSASDEAIGSDRVQIEFDAVNGGVRSLVVDGVEFAGSDAEFMFGVPVMERPEGGDRREIMELDFSQFEPADGWQSGWRAIRRNGTLDGSFSDSPAGAVQHTQAFHMPNGDRVCVTYRLFAGDPSVDLGVVLDSAGDSSPYSLVLPFVLPLSGETNWHFDTAGALVAFDDEQLPNTCRHYVTARRFVRMQTGSAALTIATPDLPLWKFGGMFFDETSNLRAEDRRPVLLAWLANNYWEVNFLANQTGRTRYRMRLLPTSPEPVDRSYERTIPYACPPHMHLYRSQGPVRKAESQLATWEGEGVTLEYMRSVGDRTLIVISNLRDAPNELRLKPGALRFDSARLATTAGEPVSEIALEADGSCVVRLAPRDLVGVLL